MVQEWLDALAVRRHVQPEGAKQRREALEAASTAAIEVQNMALAAATAELEKARTERRYNPADVDAVLAELDVMVFAAERDALAPPRRSRESMFAYRRSSGTPQFPKRQPDGFQNANQMAFKMPTRLV